MSIRNIIQKKGDKSTLFRYASLSIMSMWVFSLYSMIDAMFVGRGVGPQALAAVNLSMPFTNFTFALSIMTSIGASTLIGKFLGTGDRPKAKELFTKTIIFVVILGIVISVLGLIFRSQLAYFLGARDHMVSIVVQYLGILIIFNTFYLVAYCFEVLVRIAGKPKLALISVLTAAATNIILDYLLVIVLPMGIKGAAIATGSAQLVQMLILLPHFLNKDSVLSFVPVKFNFFEVLKIAKIGLPDSITELSVGVVTFLFNRAILSHFGDSGLISFGVISYLNYFVLMTMIGLTQGMQPIVSFLDGSKETIRRDIIYKITLKASIAIGVLSFIFIIVFKKGLISMFINDMDINIVTQKYLVLFAPSFILCGFNMVASGFLTSMEETTKAGIIALSRGILLVPLFLIILPMAFGSHILWSTLVVTEIITIFVSIYFYRVFKSKKHRHLNHLHQEI